MAPDYDRLERSIGYRFNDRAWLQLALTHRSHGGSNNERLEFLGDAVLGYVVADALHRDHDDGEDQLTLRRASLVRGTTLGEIAREFDLGDHLILGQGAAKTGGHNNTSILANAVEALIGAVHEDGGIGSAREVVLRLLGARLEQSTGAAEKDPKTRLQEWLQAHRHALPSYEVTGTEGNDHNRRFHVTCRVAELALEAGGSGTSRKAAEMAAAEQLLAELEDSHG